MIFKKKTKSRISEITSLPYGRKLNFRIFLFLIAIIFVFGVFFVPLKSLFFVISSDNYNVESAGSGLAGGSASSSSFSSSQSSGFQQGSGTVGSSDFQASAGQQSPTTTSETPTTTPSTGRASSSSAGGGTVTSQCSADWVCTEWYPSPCPENGIENRLCINKGTCTSGMPEIKRECNYQKPSGPLFDLLVNIPLSKKFITPQDKLTAELNLINVGDKKQLDVFLRYWIVDKNNNLISEAKETRAVIQEIKFNVDTVLPQGIQYGSYRFFVQIDYDVNKTAIGGDSFQVVESVIPTYLQFYSIFLVILLTVSAIAFSLFKFFGRRYKNQI